MKCNLEKNMSLNSHNNCKLKTIIKDKDENNVESIEKILINSNTKKEKQIKSHISQIGSPYNYEYCGYTVNVKFTSENTLQKKIQRYLVNKSNRTI